MEPLEFMYDYLLSGGILWKPQVGLYPDGNMGATPASARPVYPCRILSYQESMHAGCVRMCTVVGARFWFLRFVCRK